MKSPRYFWREGTPKSPPQACILRQEWLITQYFPEGWFEDIVYCPEGWTQVWAGDATPVPLGRTCYYREDDPYDFPPGGKTKTSMRKCPACKRWRPPTVLLCSYSKRVDGKLKTLPGYLCCDCEVEGSWRAWIKWVLARDRRGFRSELFRRYWREGTPVIDFIDRPMAGLLGGLTPTQEPSQALWQIDPLLVALQESGAEYTDQAGHDRDEKGPQKNSLSRQHIGEEIARRNLGWTTRTRKQVRCPYCHVWGSRYRRRYAGTLRENPRTVYECRAKVYRDPKRGLYLASSFAELAKEASRADRLPERLLAGQEPRGAYQPKQDRPQDKLAPRASGLHVRDGNSPFLVSALARIGGFYGVDTSGYLCVYNYDWSGFWSGFQPNLWCGPPFREVPGSGNNNAPYNWFCGLAHIDHGKGSCEKKHPGPCGRNVKKVKVYPHQLDDDLGECTRFANQDTPPLQTWYSIPVHPVGTKLFTTCKTNWRQGALTLRGARRQKGRHPGCNIQLLPEDKKSLRKEINETKTRPNSYYCDPYQLLPSVRRFSRPYDTWAPEDVDFWASFGPRKSKSFDSVIPNVDQEDEWGWA